jgi:hypothetical protein
MPAMPAMIFRWVNPYYPGVNSTRELCTELTFRAPGLCIAWNLNYTCANAHRGTSQIGYSGAPNELWFLSP